jgi:type I restriction enzyme, S subunit
MRKGWEIKPLGDLCHFTSGLWKGEKPPFLTIGVIRNTNFTKDGKLDESDIAFIEVEIKKFEKRRLQFGDIILEKSGGGPKQPVGRVALFEMHGDFSFSNFTSALRVKDAEQLDFRFLHKYLFWIYLSGVTEGMQSNSTGIRNLDNDAYKAIGIPLPPLEEQQRIVSILDEAFAGLASAQAHAARNLQNARALFESHLQAVFTQRGEGWVEDKLLSLTTKIGSGATPLGGEAAYKTKGVSLIRSLNVYDMGFRYQGLAFLDDHQANGLSNVIVHARDVLLNITGASVARCCVVPEDVLPARVNQHVSIIRPISEKLSPDFLHYLLISRPYKKLLLQTGEEGGATRQAITKAQIQQFKITFPKRLKDQIDIVKLLDTLSAETQHLTRIYEQKLAALAALKKSLLHQAFSGEL